mmetsp:Transcript_31489/g.53699  ORF Transcript_31489/g.53699 Transcript_31489/m.53699 type:complete len:281 (-) Transcript_31489:213-1055(-)
MSEKPSTTRNICVGLFSCAILGVAGFLTWKYALNEPSNLAEAQDSLGDILDAAGDKIAEWDFGNFTNVLDGLDDIAWEDLFTEDPQQGSNATLEWHDKHVKPINGGLHLTLQNALDEDWMEEFEIAVADWQESDALELDTERVAVDHDCKPVEEVMVVCNANFGATGWVGINENSIRNGVIIGSVAKMNEYYLHNANFAHRRFTMCHELGHGFGLPHTDENPYNKNLGNCLDYTDDPEENLLPGEVNMVKLREMYTARRRFLRRVESDGTIVETTQILAR